MHSESDGGILWGNELDFESLDSIIQRLQGTPDWTWNDSDAGHSSHFNLNLKLSVASACSDSEKTWMDKCHQQTGVYYCD